MRHDWIFDVLSDLQLYAQRNDLPETAAGAEVLLRKVRSELAGRVADDDDGGNAPGEDGSPPRSLPH